METLNGQMRMFACYCWKRETAKQQLRYAVKVIELMKLNVLKMNCR
jgi:hypothetical protein